MLRGVHCRDKDQEYPVAVNAVANINVTGILSEDITERFRKCVEGFQKLPSQVAVLLARLFCPG